MRKSVLAAALVVLVLVAAGCKVVATPAKGNGWFFTNDGSSGSGSSYFVNGPGDAPVGRGSALLTIDDTSRRAIATASYQGFKLSNIGRLEYDTYQAFSGSPNETLYLQFDVDYDSTDSSTAYQGRLVYVPQMGGTVTPKEWQTWDTLAGGVAWYSSASGGSSYRPIVGDVEQENPPCNQTTFCSWDDVLAEYPDARIRPKVGAVKGLLLVKAGGPVTGGFVGATDNVIVKVGTTVVENDFEPGDGSIGVKPSNAAKLGFAFAEETPTGSGAFVSGPAGANGSGSAQLTIDGTGGEILWTGTFSSMRLDALDALQYRTYQASGPHAATLQLDMDYDSTDSTTTWQGRAVFEPSQAEAAAVANGVWQNWNALTAPSGWWQTGTPKVADTTVAQACTQAVPCSFTELLTAYPDASIRPVTGQSGGQPIPGALSLKAGGGWTGGFTGNVDGLRVWVDTGEATAKVFYNLEP